MILGFTGTRRSLTDRQKKLITKVISLPHIEILHHGDCVGADAFAHQVALELGKYIVIHPPLNPKYRAWCMGIDVEWRPEKDYLARNRDIVRVCDLLLGVPRGRPTPHSGTWYTINYARGMNRRVKRIMP